VVGGDVLFRESVGRTDLPGGDARGLALSITREMYTLPDDYQVFPGHGEPTTIGHERRFNPFVNAAGSGLLQDK
jgi:glyoxylase-like metal-dependent hydrolase (beta-lactamase superfamily II)